MNLDTITGVVKRSNIKITTPINGIILVSTAAFTTECISASLVRPNREDINHSINVKTNRIGEIAAMDEGFMINNAGFATLYIPICPDGETLMLDDKNQIIVELTGLIADKTYDIFAVCGNRPGNRILTYERGKIENGSSAKNIAVDQFTKDIYLQNDANVGCKVNLGILTAEHSNTELLVLNALKNDIVKSSMHIGGGGSMDLGCMDLVRIPFANEANSITIKTNGEDEYEYFIERVKPI